MAENTVGLAELRVLADTFINAEFPYFTELKEAFELLKLTGCRIQEIFEIYRWRRLEGNTFELIPQKKNNPRYIILDDTFLSFKTAVDNQFAPFLGRTYSQLQGIFYKVNPYGKLYSGGKEITNYFFRYLYVRELFESGLTLSEIANHMGYSSTTAVNNYLNADLGSTIEVPVIPSDPLPEGHIDIISVLSPFSPSISPYIQTNPITSYNFSIFLHAKIRVNSTALILGSGNYGANYFNITLYGIRGTLSNYFRFSIYNYYTSKVGFHDLVVDYNQFGKFGITVEFTYLSGTEPLLGHLRVKKFGIAGLISNSLHSNLSLRSAYTPNICVGGQRSTAGVYSQPSPSDIQTLLLFNRTLSDTEMLSMFSL